MPLSAFFAICEECAFSCKMPEAQALVAMKKIIIFETSTFGESEDNEPFVDEKFLQLKVAIDNEVFIFSGCSFNLIRSVDGELRFS